MSNPKSFLYYSRISVSEGLNTELKTEICLERYDKETYKKCGYCHQVIEIKKNFKEDTDTCDVCFKLLQKEDKINTFIHIIWKENTKYRVFSDLHRIYVDKIFRREPILGKSGSVSKEQIDIYMNAFCHNSLIKDIKESLWGVMH